MFNKILIANRGDQRLGRAAAKLNGIVCAAHTGDCTAVEMIHV
jgi:hypothetical protein